jgi:outer membrane receptor for ferrienterochelin and colicin
MPRISRIPYSRSSWHFFPMLCGKYVIFLIALAGIPAATALGQQLPEEKVIVTANAYPVPFENLSRAVTVLTHQDIENLPVHSIADVLAMVAPVDLRARAPFGLQADLSVRGSAYSQVLVLVDGVRINDSQTAHHNADFPVQLQNVERIEVLLGPGSSIYGADAFGGIINIISRRDVERKHGSFSGGQHGLVEGSFAVGFRKGRLKQSISVSGSRSSGFEFDRDFRNVAVSAQTIVGSSSSIFVSHVNKEFGANGFYGPSPSREWTDQTFVSAEHNFKSGSGRDTLFQGYFRTHGDRFLYDTRTPSIFQSSHRTESAGAIVKTRFHLSDTALLTTGGELGGDWIHSNVLGDHAFGRTSLFGELQWTLGKTAVVYPGFRFDYYSNFGSAASPSLSASWWILPRLRLRSSIGRAFRIPSFTELYYRDPNNVASPTLKPESAWSAELGADFIPAKNWLGSLTLFSRRERNVIDWIRSSTAEKWRSDNIRKLRTSGVELGLERMWGTRAGFSAHYSRISTDAGSVTFISKYVLDYARDSWSAAAFFPLPLALEYRQTLTYKRRADGRGCWVMDGGLSHRFRLFTAGVDFTNLLDSRYQEVTGVDMPGRWFMFSIRTR